MNNEMKNCSFDFLKTWGDLTRVNNFVFLFKGKSFKGVDVFFDQNVKNWVNFLLSAFVFKWKLKVNCMAIYSNYNGKALKLIRTPLTKTNQPTERGRKHFHPNAIN